MKTHDQYSGYVQPGVPSQHEYAIPTQPTRDQREVNPYSVAAPETSGWWTLRRKVGAGIAALAVVAGSFGAAIGVVASNKEGTEPKQEPVATAPAIPGGEAPAPGAGEVPSVNIFPFDSEGKTYNGIEALKQKYGASVAEYPTAAEAAPQLMRAANAEINYNTKRYPNFVASDQQSIGSRALLEERAIPAFESIIFAEPEANDTGASTTDWKDLLAKLARHNLALNYQAQQQGGTFQGHYEITNVNVLGSADGASAVAMNFTYTDGNESRSGIINMTLRQTDGYWHAVSAGEQLN